MKKQLVLMAFACMFSITVVNAQGGGGQRMTPEERIKFTKPTKATNHNDE